MDREERVRSRAEADDLAYRTVVFEFMLDAGDEGSASTFIAYAALAFSKDSSM